METTETELQPELPHEPEMLLSQEAQYYLQQAGKWAVFLGIVGFVFCALFFLCALFIGTVFSMLAKFSPTGNPYPATIGPVLSVVYILLDIVYFFLVLYMYQFGRKAKQSIAFNDSALVIKAMSKLKSFFKTWGIITIVIIAFYILFFIGLIIGGIGAASMMH